MADWKPILNDLIGMPDAAIRAALIVYVARMTMCQP
jgi:hypothetical protein